MTSLSREQAQKVQHYVIHQKRKRLNTLLGCLDADMDAASSEPFQLKPSTPQADAMLKLLENRLAKAVQSDASVPQTQQSTTETPLQNLLSLDELLQAVLMIHPTYQTPWDALLKTSMSFHNISFQELVECACSMQDFFQTSATVQLFREEHNADEDTGVPQRRSLQPRTGSELASETSSSKSSKSGTTNPSSAAADTYAEDTTHARILQFMEQLMGQLLQSELPTAADQDERDSDETFRMASVYRISFELVETVLKFTRNVTKRPQTIVQDRKCLFDVLVRKFLVDMPVVTDNQSKATRGNTSRNHVTWIRLVHSNRSLFHTHHLNAMTERVLLCSSTPAAGSDGNGEWFAKDDFPEVLSLLLDLAIHGDILNDDSGKKVKKRESKDDNPLTMWHTAAVHVLYRAFSAGPDAFGAAEASFTNSLQQNWDISAIEQFIMGLPRILDENEKRQVRNEAAESISECFAWSILLPCFEVLSEKKSSVTTWSLSQVLLQDMLGERDVQTANDYEGKISKDVFQVLLDYGFGTSANASEIRDSLAEKMKDCRYRGNGSFILSDDSVEIEALSSCGRAAFSMLFPGDKKAFNEQSQEIAFERAQRIIEILEITCFDSSEEQHFLCSVLRIVLKAMAYIEIPKFRQHMVENLRSNFVKSDGELNNPLEDDFSTIEFIATLVQDHKRNDSVEESILIPLFELLDDDDIPSQYIRHLSDVFADIPEARTMILDRSKRLLAPLYSHVQQSESNHPFEEEAGRETPAVLYRTESGIHGLLHLMRGDDWDDIEINAWGILSEALVQDVPFLCFESRQELYQTIADFVSESNLGKETQEHIFRAVVVRMYRVVQMPQHDVKIEELPAVYRLLLTLFWCMASDNQDSVHRLASLAQGRDVFLRSLLAIRDGRPEPLSFMIEYATNCMIDSSKPEKDSFQLYWAVFLVLNFVILDSLPEKKLGSSPSVQSTSAWTRIGLDDVINRLTKQEREKLLSKFEGNTNNQYLPSWANSCGNPIHSNRVTNVVPSDQQRESYTSICLLLEMLFLAPLPTCTEDSVAWKMMSGAGYLLRQQWRGENDSETAAEESALDSITVAQTGQGFLSLAASLARESFRHDCDLSRADELFFAVKEYCLVLETVLRDVDDHDCADILLSLWDLYNAVACEKAALKIVNYLDSQLSEGSADLAFLSPLETRSDVNRAIRGFRLCCLDAFRTVISSSSIAEGSDEKSVIIEVVAGMLEAFAEDLQRGLDGKSGGINSKMYISYCSLIHGCANNVFEYYKSKSLDPTVLSLLDKVSSIIAGILIEFPLGSAEIFKSTFILGLVTLPSMCRSLQRVAIAAEVSDTFSLESLNLRSLELMDKTFDDCIVILSRWAQTRDPLSIPWEDIAGRPHTKSPNNSETSVVSLGSNDARLDRDNIVQQRIRLIDKEVWSWALSSSIFGLKQIWLDSHSTIRGVWFSDGVTIRSVMRDSSQWGFFYQQRKNELRHSLSKVVRFFQASADGRDHVVLDMLAMNMPSYPRDWLCSVIACISKVLTDACRHICEYLNNSTTEKTALILPLLESLCCISAWLSIDSSDNKETPTKISEFSVGIFKWMEMASRKRPPREASSARRAENKELLEKVSSVAEYVYRMYLALKDLERALRKRSVHPELQNAIKVLLAPQDGGSLPHQNQSVELLPMVSAKLRLMLKVLPRDFRERSLPDFPVIRNSSVQAASGNALTGKASAGRKRGRPAHGKPTWNSRLSSLTTSKRQRTTAMTPPQRISRNPALEAMWALDQEADHVQDGRETDGSKRKKRVRCSMYAAAADLEDFITPG